MLTIIACLAACLFFPSAILKSHAAEDLFSRAETYRKNGRYLEALRRDAVYRDSWTLKREFELKVNVLGRGCVERVPRQVDGEAHEIVELTAKAEPGWRFDGWNGILTAGDNLLLVTLDRNTTVGATFLQD